MKRISYTLFAFIGIILIGVAVFINKGKDMHIPFQIFAMDESKNEAPASDFEKAVQLIKKYEGLHQPRHWPLVGYGHKILSGERYSRSKALSENQADALLRKDLKKNIAVFREFGPDSLILGVLAYNIGSDNVKRSKFTAALRAGNRDVKDLYIAHCRYRGKPHTQIRNRRIEEFEQLFIPDLRAVDQTTDSIPSPASPSITNSNSPNPLSCIFLPQ